jgi:glycosyltransferase involved in cell wall biosynthesis
VRRLVVITFDHVGDVMSVPGIRALHFARELSTGADVTLAARSASGDVGVDVVELGEASDDAISRFVESFDVVIAQRLPYDTMRELARANTQVIYDLYVPFAVEHLGSEPRPRPERLFSEWAVAGQRFALRTGNAFVCVTERQRDLWLGMLARLGRIDRSTYTRDPALRDLIDVVPLGIPTEQPPPRAPQHGERVLLWAGGLWSWLDPFTPIRALTRLGRSDVRLVFLGTRHPRVAETETTRRARELAEQLDAPVVFNEGWVPYSDRAGHLAKAAVGVSAHFDTLETRYAFRTRLLDHFWTGLPTVTTSGDVLAEVVEQHEIGTAVAPLDVDAYAKAIAEQLDTPPPPERFDAVRNQLAWPKVIEPLRRLAALPGERVRAPLGIEDRLLRARISLALGGSRRAFVRQLRKVTR